MNESKRELTEHADPLMYTGRIEVDRKYLIARLEIARDCEAELTMLLKGAARAGIIQLEKLLPFFGERPI